MMGTQVGPHSLFPLRSCIPVIVYRTAYLLVHSLHSVTVHEYPPHTTVTRAAKASFTLRKATLRGFTVEILTPAKISADQVL